MGFKNFGKGVRRAVVGLAAAFAVCASTPETPGTPTTPGESSNNGTTAPGPKEQAKKQTPPGQRHHQAARHRGLWCRGRRSRCRRRHDARPRQERKAEMTKRVRFDSPQGVRVNETEYALMRYIASRSDGPAVLSVSELSKELVRSVVTIRNSLRSLGDKGLLEIRARYLRNGGQLENEYEVTELGHRILGVPTREDA